MCSPEQVPGWPESDRIFFCYMLLAWRDVTDKARSSPAISGNEKYDRNEQETSQERGGIYFIPKHHKKVLPYCRDALNT